MAYVVEMKAEGEEFLLGGFKTARSDRFSCREYAEAWATMAIIRNGGPSKCSARVVKVSVAKKITI